MLAYLKSIWNGNCWRLLTCTDGSQALLPHTEKEVTVFWLHPAAAAFRVLWPALGAGCWPWGCEARETRYL